MGKILKKLIIILIMIIIFIAILFFIFNHKNNQETKKLKEKINTAEKETSKDEKSTEKIDKKEENNSDTSSNDNSTDSTNNIQTSDNYSSNTQNSNSSSNYSQNYNQVEDNYIPVIKYNAKIKNNRLYVGDTTTITTVITPSNATDQEVTYTSSNHNVAIVSKTGVVTAVNPGECYITISVKNVTNTGSLKVIVLSKNNTVYNSIENNNE